MTSIMCRLQALWSAPACTAAQAPRPAPFAVGLRASPTIGHTSAAPFFRNTLWPAARGVAMAPAGPASGDRGICSVRASFIPLPNLFGSRKPDAPQKSIHEFTVKDIDGKDVSLEKYKGQVALIVNNYKELVSLYNKYKDQGFVVLAFPCNQFGNQEPGSPADIKAFVAKYKVDFPLFAKIDVNGKNEAPLYTFLKARQSELLSDGIKWNFAKFLVDRRGRPVKRYPPLVFPASIEEDVKNLLASRQ
eukprot:SM000242S08498  [mRNA]  locus=s242:104529:107101:- [translate_table: standard]